MILLPILCKVTMNAIIQLCLRPVNVSAIVLNAFIVWNKTLSISDVSSPGTTF